MYVQRSILGLFLNHYVPYLFRQDLTELGVHQYDRAGWSVSFRDLPVSPGLGLQARAAPSSSPAASMHAGN